jgi:hypothetical protein
MAQEIGAQVAVEGLLYITMPCDDGSLDGDVIHHVPREQYQVVASRPYCRR